MIQLKLEIALACGALAIGLLLQGPRAAWRELREALRSMGQREWLALAGAALLLGGMALLALGPREGLRQLVSAGIGTAAFMGLWLATLRLPEVARLVRAAASTPSWVPAVVAASAALLAQQAVLGNVPHISDEVAYQFQARAYAQGQLGFVPPAHFAFFEFIHTTVSGGLWYGIMNPGWPLMLAPAYALGVPFLVNPLLAGATLPLFHGFLLRAGAGRLAAGLSVWALALSPFVLFMAGTYMAHTAGLFLFALFLWGWIRVWRDADWLGAFSAGGALALGLAVRPVDAAAVALPFGLALAVRAIRHPRWLPTLLAIGLVGSTGALGTLAYNRAVTGDPLVFPQTQYFEERFPGQSFGLGFGPEMGSKVHGPEWPGYAPSDAPRVTSQRSVEWLRNLWGLPWLTAALILWGLGIRGASLPQWLLGASALSLLAIFLAHFYHGIAYGSRHYFLAVPAAALMLGGALSQGLAADSATRRRTGAAVLGVVLYMITFATPPLVIEYGDAYRMASSSLRRAVADAELDQALVFVASEQWGWKSGFPLNEYPLGRAPVLYAQDRGEENATLRAAYPERRAWLATRHGDDSVSLDALP
ncbi:MAG: hypothetical protein JRH01_14955 [Deltaproteobacteria bacterium]|nr:hypothetical protein [Deltaproteobacteria bacterium]MBW2395518.1 hypothetical protein [Deltaproteobacteria bacterium]